MNDNRETHQGESMSVKRSSAKRKDWSTAEEWLWRHLRGTMLKWTREAPSRFYQWTYQIRIELESPQHDAAADAFCKCDACGEDILVIHVRESNDLDAANALKTIEVLKSWDDGRRALGLPETVEPADVS
jgi:hypothetical protein